MVRLPKGATDEDIIAAIARWNDLMAAGDWEAAAGIMPDDELSGEEFRRCVEKQCSWAGEWFGDPNAGPPYRITPFAGARLHPGRTLNPTSPFPIRDFLRNADGVPHHVISSLPLNGYWSVLSAMFDVDADGDGLSLYLVNLRVM